MKIKLLAVALIGLSFTACTNPYNSATPAAQRTGNYQKPTPVKQKAYSTTMRSIASGIKNDPKYHRIALDTPEKKAWFRDLTYRLWDRQITSYQFVAKGLEKYPERKYEFQFVVNGFQKNS